MPITLADAQKHHPLELTRQASPEVPMITGEFTLSELGTRFGIPEGSEAEILKVAGNSGQAFFKSGDLYIAFAPQLGEAIALTDPISQEDHEVFDDAEDPDDAELDLDSELLEVDELETIVAHPLSEDNEEEDEDDEDGDEDDQLVSFSPTAEEVTDPSVDVIF